MDALAVDVDLHRALSANDRRRAGTLLVTHYASDVFALCRAIVRNRDVAEDLAQDAFQKALVALPSFRGESSARTWLLSIARNRCLDHLRSAKSSPFARDDNGETDAHPSPEAPVLDLLVRHEDVERALGPLDETERAIVVLFHGHGVGYPELAQAFGLREGALRMRMSRATAKMREVLATDGARTGRELRDEEQASLDELASDAPARRARKTADDVVEQRRGGGVPQRPMAPPAYGSVPTGGAPPPQSLGALSLDALAGASPDPRAADARTPVKSPGALLPAAAGPGRAVPVPSRTPAAQPMVAASRGLGTPSPVLGEGGAGGTARDEGLGTPKGGVFERVKSMIFGAQPASAVRVAAAPSAPPPRSALLRDDAPASLVDRLLALVAAQP